VEFAQPLRDEVADRLFINLPLHTLLIATQLTVGFFSQPTEVLLAGLFPQSVEDHFFDHHQIHFEQFGRDGAG
jgi:hypothetical protein